MISSAAIDALVAAGCTAEQVAAAVKADVAAIEAATEAKRAKDRERKRVERAAHKVVAQPQSEPVRACPAESTGVQGNPRTTMESADIVDDGSSLSPVPLLPPTPPNNPLTPKPISKTQNPRAHRLPENAAIAGPDLAYGLSKGLTQRETGELWQRMASWAWSAGGANAKKVNWHQAFQGWVQRDGPEIIRKRTPGKPLTEHQRKQHELKDILHDLDNFAAGGGRGDQENSGALRYDSSQRSSAIRGGSHGDLVDISPGSRHQSG